MFLSDAIEGFILFRSGGQVSETTVATDRNHLKQFLRWKGDCDVAIGIKPADIQAYMNYQRQDRKLSIHTVIRHRAAISCLYNWLEEIGVTDEDPTDKAPPPRKPERIPRSLTEQQIKQLVQCASTTNNPRRDRAITLLLLDSCARNSEARKIQLPDIDFSTGRVRVIGKGDRQRDTFLGKRALSACWLYKTEARPEPAMVGDETFFLTSDGYGLGRSGFRQIFSRMSEDLGFRVYPHLLRHVCLLNHLKNGLSLVSVQMLAGHRDIRTTRHYLSALRASEVGRVARRTSPSDNWRL